MASSVRFGVLGPLVAEDADGPLALKGPRHRAVLARLLVARGRVVPVDVLAADLWDGEPPDGAAGAIQTFVAALRKALEPQRPPRAPARLLVTAAPGYALRAEPEAVDAVRFESALTASGEALTAGRPGPALAAADDALALWRGPAYAEFAEQPWARAEASRLEELRLLAAERRAEALLGLGRAAEVVPDLESQVERHPWREDTWRLLALALYRAGRQGDALAALRRARAALAEDLGVDPGPALARLETDILAHAGHLAPRAEPTRSRAAAEPGLVGRACELAALEEAAAATAAGGRLRLVLVSGEAGAGKTALAEAFAAGLAAQGWTAAWGPSPEHEGVPADWPWTRILAVLAESGHGPAPAPGGDPATARFHWQHAVGTYLAEAARRSPLLLVLDDLHWAGEDTLELLASLSAEPVPGPVLIVGTYRATDIAAPLAGLLGRVARAEPTRVYLGGLSAGEVSDLVRALAGHPVDAETAQRIHRRSGGNPFFVRELARLLDGEEPDGLTAAPPGVRDVVRYRVAALPGPVQDVLRLATVLGTELDLDLLAPLAGGEERALDAAETAALRGFLVEEGARHFRFAHALVRDALYADLSRSRRARWHAAAGELLERLRPWDVAALAHHFLLAGTADTAGRAARYARAAAERAESRFAPHEAARLWQAALAAQERAGDGEPEPRLSLLMGLVRALAFTGELARARTHRAEALRLAESVGDPALTASVIAAFDVPAVWTEHDDPALAARVAEVTERTLAALPSERIADRSRLLATLALELRSTGGDRARAAAEEAERLARGLDDPAVLAFALNARFMQSFERAGLAPRRAAIGAELVELAGGHGLGGFEVLGHLVLLQSHAALAEFGAADRHADAADALAERHRLPLVGVFTGWYAALRDAVRGHAERAQAAYREAAARLARTSMSGVDNGIGALALLCHRLQQGLPAEAEPDADFGGYEPWCRPLLLLARGRTAEASTAAAAVPDSPPDLLLEARLSLHALSALALGDRPTMERLYTALLPAAGELAGAGSGLVTLRPVAHYLGSLASALGRRRDAAHHAEQAAAVAERAGARHWVEAARAVSG